MRKFWKILESVIEESRILEIFHLLRKNQDGREKSERLIKDLSES